MECLAPTHPYKLLSVITTGIYKEKPDTAYFEQFLSLHNLSHKNTYWVWEDDVPALEEKLKIVWEHHMSCNYGPDFKSLGSHNDHFQRPQRWLVGSLWVFLPLMSRPQKKKKKKKDIKAPLATIVHVKLVHVK